MECLFATWSGGWLSVAFHISLIVPLEPKTIRSIWPESILCIVRLSYLVTGAANLRRLTYKSCIECSTRPALEKSANRKFALPYRAFLNHALEHHLITYSIVSDLVNDLPRSAFELPCTPRWIQRSIVSGGEGAFLDGSILYHRRKNCFAAKLLIVMWGVEYRSWYSWWSVI